MCLAELHEKQNKKLDRIKNAEVLPTPDPLHPTTHTLHRAPYALHHVMHGVC